MRHDFLPVGGRRFARVDGDHARFRRLVVRLEEEHGAVIVDERVRCVERFQQADHLGVLLAQVLVEHAVLAFRALRGRDDQVIAVVADGAAAERPFLLVGTVEDEHVVALRRADLVEVQFLEVIDIGQLGRFVRRIIAAVEETLVVLGPRGARELGPLDVVRQILARFDVAHFPLVPVGTGGGRGVGQVFAVRADRGAGQRHRAVGGQGVRVQQQTRLVGQFFHRVQHGLVLQAIVAAVEVTAALFRWRRETLIVPQLGQPLLDRRALGNRAQVRLRQPVLRRHPFARLGAVGVFQPAVGIGNRRAEIAVLLVDFFADRIGHGSAVAGRAGLRHGIATEGGQQAEYEGCTT